MRRSNGGFIGILAAAIAGLLGFLIGDAVTGESRDHTVIVIESYYEQVRTGVGYGFTSDGESAMVVTSSGPEYSLLVEFEDGSRDIVSTNKAALLAAESGKRTVLTCSYGGITGSRYRCRL